MSTVCKPVWLIVLALILVMISPVRGAPPSEYRADPSLSEWFRSLERPDVGGSCCDRSDCREVSSRIGPSGYRVLLEPGVFPVAEPQWVDIPAEKIIKGKSNPTGRGVVCWLPYMGVICYAPGVEG